MYPLSRDYMAEGLIVLAELGALYTTFDVEFVDRSPAGGRLVPRGRAPQEFGLAFSTSSGTSRISSAPRGEARLRRRGSSLADDLTTYTASEKDQLLARVGKVARDNDEYLGGAVRLFGRTVLTVNALDWTEETTDEDLRKHALESSPWRRSRSLPPRIPSPRPWTSSRIYPVVKGALAAGFPR